MNPDSPIAISLDYLVELSDDGKQADQAEPEVIIIPPPPRTTDASTVPPGAPEQAPQT